MKWRNSPASLAARTSQWKRKQILRRVQLKKSIQSLRNFLGFPEENKVLCWNSNEFEKKINDCRLFQVISFAPFKARKIKDFQNWFIFFESISWVWQQEGTSEVLIAANLKSLSALTARTDDGARKVSSIKVILMYNCKVVEKTLSFKGKSMQCQAKPASKQFNFSVTQNTTS